MSTGRGSLLGSDAIDDAQLKTGIGLSQIEHLLFTLSGNNLLQTDRVGIYWTTGRRKGAANPRFMEQRLSMAA